MSELLLLTDTAASPAAVLPALGLLLHQARCVPADPSSLAEAATAEVVLVDARQDLLRARDMCRLLRRADTDGPVIVVTTEGGLAAVTAEWGVDEILLVTAGPAEVEARVRLALARRGDDAPAESDEIRSGDLAIDEPSYTARLRGRVLDLTFKEFELLKFLTGHPSRVFTRAHLLQEVWGYDYFGGTRTVDVHVRRLRAKLGPEHEALIGTVRNVGYRFVPAKPAPAKPARGTPAREIPARGTPARDNPGRGKPSPAQPEAPEHRARGGQPDSAGTSGSGNAEARAVRTRPPGRSPGAPVTGR